jgi:small subunit ribosomal protein S14
MAKKSKIAKDAKRRATVERYAAVRAELLAASVDPGRPAAEREAAMRALHRLPRDASPTRLRNRDAVDGRPRGHLRQFGVSRVRFRELTLGGYLPGVTKSSW